MGSLYEKGIIQKKLAPSIISDNLQKNVKDIYNLNSKY